MGPATTAHMLSGAVIGWAMLSPLAKHKGWAPGPVGDWETGSRGWIIWISLAIMLVDSVINLGWMALRPLLKHAPRWVVEVREHSWSDVFTFGRPKAEYAPLSPANPIPLIPITTSLLSTPTMPSPCSPYLT